MNKNHMSLFFMSIAIVMLLLVVGCGQSQTDSDTGTVPSVPATPPAGDAEAPSAPSEPATAPATVDTATNPSAAAETESASARNPQTWNVKIKDFKFLPGDLTVKAGDTVTWTNEDSAPHTATAEGGIFDSDRLTKGASFSFTFNDVGNFAYFCAIHPSMTATVKVE